MKNKTCRDCGETKALSEFYKRKDMKDGHANQCKDCHKLSEKKYRQENAEKVRQRRRKYRQENPEKIREASRKYYQKNSESIREYKKGYYQENRAEKLEYQSKYYQQNRDAAREARKRWRQENTERVNLLSRNSKARRRARKKQNGTFKVTNKDLAKIYMMPCASCGSTKDIQVDHVIPISRGGVHSVGNLQPLCESCNYGKRAKYMIEWKRHKQQYG